MSFVTEVIKMFWLTEQEPSAWSVLIWRMVVSSFMTISIIFVIWSVGHLFGMQGFAFADDVNTKIAAAIKPMSDRLDGIETTQSTQSGYLKRLVKSDLERLIDREILARCNATSSAEKQRIKSAIDAYQEDYEDVFGDEYDEPRCAEL